MEHLNGGSETDNRLIDRILILNDRVFKQLLKILDARLILCLLVYMRRVIAPMKRVSVDAEITSTEKEFACK